MKCKHCDGKGYTYVRTAPNPITGYGYKRICDKCHGTGEIKQTEQEYIQTCTTEQLAEVLADISLWIIPFMKQKNRFELLKKQFYEWLKQPHTNKE